jgi:hypothetical protein
MKSSAISLGILCIAFPIPGHTEIYKCTNDASVVIYRDTPCSTEQVSITLTPAPIKTPISDSRLPALEPRSPAQSPNAGTLALGMTDTEILNKRGWGLPARITRSKVNRSFIEEWIYISAADGQTILQFTDGKLAAINQTSIESAADASQQTVQFDAGRAMQ